MRILLLSLVISVAYSDAETTKPELTTITKNKSATTENPTTVIWTNETTNTMTTPGVWYSGPRILYLKDLSVENGMNLKDVEPGSHIYLSSNDNVELLTNISISSGASNLTLDNLYDLDENGLPRSFTINQGGLNIQFSNKNLESKNLTGFLYITTREQAKDPTFFVYVIKTKQFIDILDINGTFMILNTQLLNDPTEDSDKPLKTSLVSKLEQDPQSTVSMHSGTPFGTDNGEKTRFFENPLSLNNSKKFFDYIQPLQIPFDYWYFKVSGNIHITIENKYQRSQDYTTTKIETTGIVINNDRFFRHNLNFLIDPTRERTTGAVVSSHPSSEAFLNFIFSSDNGASYTTSFNNESIITDAILTTFLPATKLVISSTSRTPGKFTCQYFGFSGELLPTTTTRRRRTTAASVSTVSTATHATLYTTSENIVRTTTMTTTAKPVITTTKSAAKVVNYLFFIFIGHVLILQ